MTTERGLVMSVDTTDAADFVAGAVTAGTSLLPVANTDIFETGDNTGSVQINGATYDYTAVDSDASTITLATPLLADADDNDTVYVWPLTPEKLAQIVLMDSDGDALTVRVTNDQAIFSSLVDRIREPGTEEIALLDFDGEEPVITEVVNAGSAYDAAQLDPDTTIPMLNLDESGINGQITEQWGLIAQQIDVDIILADGTIIVGDQNGSHLVLDKDTGLTLYGPDGITPTVTLDLSAAQLSTFTGKIIASELSVLNGLELRGMLSRIVNSARVTLAGSIASPTSAPGVSQGVNTRPWAYPTGYNECGLWWDGTYWYQLIYDTAAKVAKVRTIDSSGTSIASVTLDNDYGDQPYRQPNGLVKGGSSFYTLRRDNFNAQGGRGWALFKYSTSGGTATLYPEVVALENDLGNSTPYPTLGYDGTNLLVATLDRTHTRLGGGLNDVVGKFDTSFNFVAFLSLSASFANEGESATYVGIGNHDYGANRVVVGGKTIVSAFTVSGTTLTADTTYPTWTTDGTIAALGWDGSNFFSAANANALKKYSNFLGASPAARKFWAQYAWENGANATTPSAAVSLSLKDRRYLTIAIPTPGAGTTTTRVFTGNGSSQPANSAMYSRGTTTGVSMQLSTSVGSGANPRTVSDFTTGTPADIVSETGGFQVKGDGTGDWPLMTSIADSGWVTLSASTGGTFTVGDSAAVRKVGKYVTIRGSVSRATGSSTGFTDAVDIPSGYRPAVDTPINVGPPSVASAITVKAILTSAGKLRVAMSAANSASMALNASWFVD